MLPHFKLISLAGIVLLAALATPALAGTLYKWTAEDGSVSWTDDPKRVPERYRSQVESMETGGLDSYGRFTPEDSSAVAAQRTRFEARLDRLRESNAVAGPAVPGGAPAGPVSETVVQVNDRTAVRIPVSASDEGPIVVEEVRVKRDGSLFTIHDTVVRQGDKVLMVVSPAQAHEAGPGDWIDEDDLFD